MTVDCLDLVGELYYPANVSSPRPVLCICHGIPAGRADPSDRGYPILAERFAGEGFLTAIFNFRGCGESEGNLDLLDWTRDLEGILSFLSELEGADTSRLSLMGFSGGAAASAYVAARDNRVKALVLCACPAHFSIGGLGRRPEEFVEQCRTAGTIRDPDFPPSLDEWTRHFQDVSPIDCIDRVAPRPLLIVHGDGDETIPVEHAQRLYAMAGEPKDLVIVPEGEHRLRTNEAAMEAALAWLKDINHL